MNHWCGIPRALELEATPGAFIDDAWARGDFDARRAEAHVEVEGLDASKPMKVRDRLFGTGRMYLHFGPSKKSVKRVCHEVH